MPRHATPLKNDPLSPAGRAKSIVRLLKKEYPDSTLALSSTTALELLVATILSAQCTDARVNLVTPALFKRFRTAQEYATASQEELEGYIRSTGFYRAKAKSIINCCRMLLERFNGEVPSTMEELVQLPGVGRKTANVVLSNVFGKAEGIVVDTHVKRLAGRLGLTQHTDPEKIELDLMNIVPKKQWHEIGDLLVLHGRNVCDARKPDCPSCSVAAFCPSAFAAVRKK